MGFMESVQNIEQHLKTFAEDAAAKLEQDLPVVAGVASQLASNPAFAALSAAAHLNAAPELLASLADWIAKADAGLAAAKAQGAAEAQQAAVPAAEAPAEAPPSA
jgi:hypothetical protein